MYQIYRKIINNQFTQEQLEFWRDRTEKLTGPWSSKIHDACVLRLEGIVKDDHSPTEKPEQSNQVELSWSINRH